MAENIFHDPFESHEGSKSEADKAALLERLDRAARELDAGEGVPISEVRKRVKKWARV